ncbi:MAG TPA: MlaA family lipoprotein [Methylomirabilota bacterium]|nr:MlaA family lipoprotein [Methylomirabilota bacterium]
MTLSGCGTLSAVLRSDSAVLAASSAPPESAAAPETVSAAVPAETRGDTGAAVTPVVEPAPEPFLPASFDIVRPDEQMPYMVASLDPVVVGQQSTPGPPPERTVEEYDPWEPFNEAMFEVNRTLDKWVLKPVAQGYNFVVPDLIQQMLDNAFANLKAPALIANNVLQWNWKGAATELGRLFINTIIGVAGFFDIARQEFGLQKTKADFGQTLGVWGVGPGPYLILPLLAPMTVRDGIGTAVDGAMDPMSYYVPFIWERLSLKVADAVNDRSLNLELYQGVEESTVDLYSAVRNAYLQRRDALIKSAKEGRSGQ